jgi:hypothetical protein
MHFHPDNLGFGLISTSENVVEMGVVVNASRHMINTPLELRPPCLYIPRFFTREFWSES